MKQNQNLLLVSILIISIFSIILSVSFAFRTTRTSGNENISQTLFKNKRISIEYSDGNNKLTTTNMGMFNPGSVLTKNFTIKNTGNKEAKYTISLKNVVNTFERKNDITYELKSNNTIVNSGIFPSNDVILLENEIVLENETKYYTLTIKYNESQENQIIDNGKSISAIVDLY